MKKEDYKKAITELEKAPYAGWMQEVIAQIALLHPKKICIYAETPAGEAATCYFGMESTDKAVASHHIHMDSIYDALRVNGIDVGAEEE